MLSGEAFPWGSGIRKSDRLGAIYRWQGYYFLISGIWPLVHLPSFEKVTGPKRDKWLVKTVGLLIAVVGVTLIRSSKKKPIPGELRFLARGAAFALGGVDVNYAAKNIISKIYLADAALELILGMAPSLLNKIGGPLPDSDEPTIYYEPY